MDNATFGFTMAVIGMGGTLLTLAAMALLISALTAFLPPEDKKEDKP